MFNWTELMPRSIGLTDGMKSKWLHRDKNGSKPHRTISKFILSFRCVTIFAWHPSRNDWARMWPRLERNLQYSEHVDRCWRSDRRPEKLPVSLFPIFGIFAQEQFYRFDTTNRCEQVSFNNEDVLQFFSIARCTGTLQRPWTWKANVRAH